MVQPCLFFVYSIATLWKTDRKSKKRTKKRDRVASVSFLKVLIKELILQQVQQERPDQQQVQQVQQEQQVQQVPAQQQEQQVQQEQLLSSVLQLAVRLSGRSQQMILSS